MTLCLEVFVRGVEDASSLTACGGPSDDECWWAETIPLMVKSPSVACKKPSLASVIGASEDEERYSFDPGRDLSSATFSCKCGILDVGSSSVKCYVR